MGTAFVLAVSSALLFGACGRAVSAPEPRVIFERARNLAPNPGLEDGLAGWNKGGEAEFAVDSAVKHSGKASARITVGAESKPSWQNISFTVPVTPGRECFASFWLRCENVTDGGAYCALQFYRGERRVGIQQTPFMTANGWRFVSVRGPVPYDAQKMTLTLLLHARGTAWFDDVRLLFSQPQPLRVELALQPQKVITQEWLGFGAQGDLYIHGEAAAGNAITDADRELVVQRIRAMRPQIVRLIFNLRDWEPERGKPTPDSDGMKDLRKTLAIYQEIGADIHLNEWGWVLPEWGRFTARAPHPDERQAFTDSFGAAVKYLREQCGITRLKYVTLYNEPNWGGIPWEDYTAVYRCLDTSLKAAGLDKDVCIVGPDEANNLEWIPRTIREMDDLIDCYSAHGYTSYEGSEFGRWVARRAALMRKTGPGGRRKPLMLAEFGGFDGESWCDTYGYGVFVADAAVASANNGASAALMWCMADWCAYWLPKPSFQRGWGLWKYRDENWELRPGFYSWSLITRYTERGSSVHRVTCSVADAAATALRAPGKGAWSILVVNRRPESRPVVVTGLPRNSRWEPYVYSRDTVPTEDRQMIRAGAIRRADGNGALRATLPATSFTLWRQAGR